MIASQCDCPSIISSHQSSEIGGGFQPNRASSSLATNKGLALGRMTVRRSAHSEATPDRDCKARMSASGGECLETSSGPTSCQMGRTIPRRSRIILETRPLSSHCVHGFWKKDGLSTTMPNRAPAKPRSIDWRRLSPTRRENSSYQTSMCSAFRALAKGVYKPVLVFACVADKKRRAA